MYLINIEKKLIVYFLKNQNDDSNLLLLDMLNKQKKLKNI